MLNDTLILYFSVNAKPFMFYRIPAPKCKKIRDRLSSDNFKLKNASECEYAGSVFTHTINFTYKSCTCRWFSAFSVCAHILLACDHFDRPLDGYK